MSAPLARDTAELLAGLDRHKLARGSAELYDALLYGSPKRVADELRAVQRHPLHEELARWLVARGEQPPAPPSNDEILARLGIEDIEAHLARKDAEIAKLRKELADISTRGHDALKAATGYSFTTVLLAGVAVMGWLAAFGVLPFSPQVIPTLDELKQQQESKGQDDGNGVGIEGPGGQR